MPSRFILMKRHTARLIVWLLLLTLSLGSLAACSVIGAGNGGPNRAAPARRPWTNIHNWVYWLDNPDLTTIGASAYELAVIDYSADGSGAQASTAAQIARLRTSGCQRRVVAYLSIGEAENYRWYWQNGWRPGGAGSPSWLAAEDSDWPGNYWVRYWEPAWQKIVFAYLDKIIAAGFDGIYLDRIDAYAEPYANGHEDDMLAFVQAIASYARTHSPLGHDFGVIAQNAEELGPGHPDYVRALTGIGREETYVQAMNDPTAPSDTAEAVADLQVFRQQSQGHLVLTVDYATQADLIRMAYTKSRAQGFIPYVTDDSLSSMRINPGFAPTCSG
ncbi:MAG TPA: MJ1477/TM1410 family putative glycoside hydrolase [Ktedonobacterales bacterium]|nr:MJ1477/TM1410 family putative glycoside hydrolase [Ktedonobacterales bacterium]